MGGGIKNIPLNIVIIITIIMIMSSSCTGSNVGIMGGGSKNFSTCSLSAMHATLQPIVRSRYIYWHLIYWDCPMYPKVIWFFNQLSSWFRFIHLFKNSTEKLKEIFQTRRELLFHSGPVKPWKGDFFKFCQLDIIYFATQATVSKDDLGWIEAACPALPLEEDEVCAGNPDPPEVL